MFLNKEWINEDINKLYEVDLEVSGKLFLMVSLTSGWNPSRVSSDSNSKEPGMIAIMLDLPTSRPGLDFSHKLNFSHVLLNA